MAQLQQQPHSCSSNASDQRRMLLCLVAAAAAARPGRVAMVWVPDSALNGNTNSTLSGLAPLARSRSFNALAFQAYSLCGSGDHNCNPKRKHGPPVFACTHSDDSCAAVAKTARAVLGQGVAIWPMISADGPDCGWLDSMMGNKTLSDAFTSAAIAEAHTVGFAGYNLDFECHGINGDERPSKPGQYDAVFKWLSGFASALHAASPRIGVSYDTGVGATWGTAGAQAMVKSSPVDRLISMETYTPKGLTFDLAVASWVGHIGERYGVGLCPACQKLTPLEISERFATIDLSKISEIDIWAYPDGNITPQWWSLLQKWIARP